MELEEWEFLPENSLLKSQSKEEISSPAHEDQHGFFAQIEAEKTILEKDPDDNFDRDQFKEISEGSGAVPQAEKLEEIECKVESPKSSTEGIAEVGSDVLELEIAKSLSFEEEEVRKDQDDDGLEVEGKDSMDGFDPSIGWWKLRGIGALISSIGIAAATLSLVIFGGCHRNKTQELQIQVYGGDKRIKQVMHHATRLNQALLAMRGAPATTANISFGGYYQSL